MESFYAEYAKAYPASSTVISVQKVGGGEVGMAYENSVWRYLITFIEGTSVYVVAKGSLTVYGHSTHEEYADRVNEYYEDGDL